MWPAAWSSCETEGPWRPQVACLWLVPSRRPPQGKGGWSRWAQGCSASPQLSGPVAPRTCWPAAPQESPELPTRLCLRRSSARAPCPPPSSPGRWDEPLGSHCSCDHVRGMWFPGRQGAKATLMHLGNTPGHTPRRSDQIPPGHALASGSPAWPGSRGVTLWPSRKPMPTPGGDLSAHPGTAAEAVGLRPDLVPGGDSPLHHRAASPLWP